MRNDDGLPLPRQTRAFIVLVAMVQALLLYAAWSAQEHLWGWLSSRGTQVYWYTLILAVPTMMTLSVRHLGDRRFWQHAAGVAVVYALLATWAAWSVTGAPGINATSVLLPFGITLGGALFVALPFLQCGQEQGHWRAPYADLFDHAWQNGLTLLLALLFTGLCWVVLRLWAELFALVHIRFFLDLFFDSKPVVFLATGLFAGLGILIGRTQHHPLRVARQILFAVCRGLLPLLALIALMFLASLPFTGLSPLWATRSAAALLLGLLLLLVAFVNAVWQDGVDAKPYPRVLRWLIDAALLLSPVYAGLAGYALALRIGQYGWTDQRFWAALVAVVLACHSVGYAAAAVHRKGAWLGWLPRVNVALAGVVVLLAVLANSPVLDPYRLSVTSQVRRLHAGRVSPAKLDVEQLRFDNGRRGYRAAVALQADPKMHADPSALAFLEHTVKRSSPDVRPSTENSRWRVADAAALRAQIALAPGAVAPDDGWYQALMAGKLEDNGCLARGSDCVLLTPDLRGDGDRQNLLCSLDGRNSASCRLSVRDAHGAWKSVALATLSGKDEGHAVQDALREGRLTTRWPRWPDIEAGGAKGSFTETCECDLPPVKAKGAPAGQ